MTKKISIFALLLAVMCTTAVQAGLVAHWKLDETANPSVDTVAVDATGNGYDGTYEGAGSGPEVGLDSVNPAYGTSALFHGVYDGINVGTFLCSYDNDFTVAAWVKPETFGGLLSILSNENHWRFYIQDNYLHFTARAVKDYKVSISSFPVNEWMHVAMVMDATNDCSFYVNGELLGKVVGNRPAENENNTPYIIGRISVSTSWSGGFIGNIDDVRFYDNSLSAAEMKGLVALNNLIPEDFDSYASNVDLAQRWASDDLFVGLDEINANSGFCSIKTVGSGTVTKDAQNVNDYTDRIGTQMVSLWYKGVADNPQGNITLSLIDVDGTVEASKTFYNATNNEEWSQIYCPIEDDLNDPNDWEEIAKVSVNVSSDSIIYFDDLDFAPIPVPAVKVVEWKFNEAAGMTAADSSGNLIDGTLADTMFTDASWIADGGRSGEASDNALQFDGVSGQTVYADDVTSDVFAGATSFTINQWVYLDEAAYSEFFGGFGSGVSVDGTTAFTERYVWADGNGNINFWTQSSETVGGTIYSSTKFDVNKWQMITVTYDAFYKTGKIYKNAELIAQRNNFVLNDAVNRIGVCNLHTKNLPPKGKIDDFSIWKGAMSQDEIIDQLWGGWICLDPSIKAFDYDGNCKVDIVDLSYFASQWLSCARYPESFCN